MGIASRSEILPHGCLERLKTNFERFEPLLDRTGEWKVEELDRDNYSEYVPGIIEFLVENGALEVLRRENHNQKGRVCVYRWKPSVKETLQDYRSHLDTLPCPRDHRAHIYNDPELPSDKLGCRYCAQEGYHPEFSKNTVKGLL